MDLARARGEYHVNRGCLAKLFTTEQVESRLSVVQSTSDIRDPPGPA